MSQVLSDAVVAVIPFSLSVRGVKEMSRQIDTVELVFLISGWRPTV